MATKKRRSVVDRSAVFESILGDLGEDQAAPSLGSVPLAEVRFNRKQPRKYIDEASLDDLTASIRDKGVLEPIIVRTAGEGYELVAGERRTRAAKRAGLAEIPAIVVDIDDREALEVSIIENLQREDLNAVEETDAVLTLLEITTELDREAVQRLLQEMYSEERGRAPSSGFEPRQKAVATALFRRLGRFTPSSFVSNRLPILNFPTALLEAVRSGKLAFTKAQAIARLGNAEQQEQLAREAMEEQLSLSQIRRRITELRKADTLERSGPPLPAEELLSSTKRLLNQRRLSSLESRDLERVTMLLRELRGLLEG